jgi:hypothetical protein
VADTRSWHLLPARLEVLRLRLPAGRQPLVARIDGRPVALGDVSVRAGGIAFVGVRLWDDAGRPTVAGAVPGAAGI